MRIRIAMSLGVALLLALAAGRPAVGADDDTAGIKAKCEAFVAGFNKHDAKAMAANFAEDADMVGPDGKLLKGRAEIEKALAADHTGQGMLRESSLRVIDEPIRVITPDVAVSDARAVVSNAYGPNGQKMATTNLMVTNVWKKTGGQWWLVATRMHVQATEHAPS